MSRMQLILENDNKLRYVTYNDMHDAQVASETEAIRHHVRSRPFTRTPFSGSSVVFSQLPRAHTKPTRSYTTRRRDLIHDPAEWRASFDILSSRNARKK